MTKPVFVIRPEPGFAQTMHRGREWDLDMRGEPLFAIQPVAWKVPDAGRFDGLLLGSANAIRHGGPALSGLSRLPVYAVGQSTADAAAAQGFAVAQTGEGGLQQLVSQLGKSVSKRPLRLLRLSAEDRVALDPPAGVTVVERVVYRSAPQPMSRPFAQALASGGIVLLHSARAAEHFVAQCARCAIDRSRLDAIAIGPRVTQAAGVGWRDMLTADAPEDGAMLALARKLCNKG